MIKKLLVIGMIILFLSTSITQAKLINKDTFELSTKSCDFIPDQTNVKDWTYMIYDSADWASTPSITKFGSFGVRSTSKLNVVSLQDQIDSPGKLLHINRFGRKKILHEYGEINMSDYRVLKDFISYCKENFPAKRYYLEVHSHSLGWYGACLDMTNNGDKFFLTMKVDDMQKALFQSGGVDIISFMGPCNMCNIETIYELRNCTDVVIARELGGDSFSPLLMSKITKLLDKNYYLDTFEIAYKVIETINGNDKVLPYFCSKRTVSAIRTDKIVFLAKKIDELANYIIDNLDLLKLSLSPISMQNKNLFTNSEGLFYWKLIDIINFTNNLLKNNKDNEKLSKLISNVSNAVEKCVINHWHKDEYNYLNGIAIAYYEVIPIKNRARNGWDPSIDSYKNSNLDFVKEFKWDELFTKINSKYVTVRKDGKGNYTSIQNAIDNVSNGDVIYILNGTYFENLEINKPLLLFGEDRNTTIIDGRKNKNVVNISSDKVQINGISIKNSDEKYSGVKIQGNNITITECKIIENGIGLNVIKSNNNLIKNNKIGNNSKYGLFLNCSNENILKYNFFYDNKNHISFYNSFKNIYLQNIFDSKAIKFIFGKIKIGRIKIPWLSVNSPGLVEMIKFFL